MRYIKFLFLLAALAWPLSGPNAAKAGDSEAHKITDGIELYLGVQPAALVSRVHPGAEMHDGVPSGRNFKHVMVAVYDATSGERIEDATVEARVTPLGLATITRPLEPMVIADTITYGNFFNMAIAGQYEIEVAIKRAEVTQPTIFIFPYYHRTH